MGPGNTSKHKKAAYSTYSSIPSVQHEMSYKYVGDLVFSTFELLKYLISNKVLQGSRILQI